MSEDKFKVGTRFLYNYRVYEVTQIEETAESTYVHYEYKGGAEDDEALDRSSYRFSMHSDWGDNSEIISQPENKTAGFEEVVRPVVKWLTENKNYDPHTTIRIEYDRAYILQEEAMVLIED